MELKSIELSRLIHLTTIRRERGQLYFPGVALELVRRYRFVKAPANYEEFSSTPIRFEGGAFGDIGIQEFLLYNDGLVVASRSNTDTLAAFVRDLLEWASEEHGLVEVSLPTNADFYESQVVVSLSINQNKLMPWAGLIQKRLSRTIGSYGLKHFEFGFGGVALAIDQTKTVGPYPGFFKLEPRGGIPFEQNIYYSVAPLKTEDHLDLLRDFERQFPA